MAYYSTVDRTKHNLRVDDDGSNTVGTIWNKAEVGKSYDDLDKTFQLLGRAHVYRTAPQTLINDTFVPLLFDGEDMDDNAMHGPGESRLTIGLQQGGHYLVGASVTYAANPTGVRGLRLYKNTSIDVHTGVFQAAAGGAIGVTVQLHTILLIGPGDYLEVVGYQNSGGSLDIAYGPRVFGADFWAIRIL